MQAVKRCNTQPEMALRRELHRRGLRYRVDLRPEPAVPRRADVVFRRARVAVFVDGCFWHGCPTHRKIVKANTEWWRNKIETTAARDADTTRRLEACGWTVVRAWEHEDAKAVADGIEQLVREKAPPAERGPHLHSVRSLPKQLGAADSQRLRT
jgi:DNA mismatch endonuclease (patch repair protein)